MNLLELSQPFIGRGRRYIEGGPRHLLMYIFGRFHPIRCLLVWAHSLKQAIPLPAEAPTLVEEVDIDGAVGAICQDGLFAGLQLRKDVMQQLLTFSSLATCYGDGKIDYPFRYSDDEAPPFRVGRYNHALQACPALQALASDAQLLAIARKYLHAEPVLLGARMWWSFAGPSDAEQQREAGQGFHYDIDGYRALTFFFYLTDVGPANGPHVFVRGSHVEKPLRYLVSLFKGRSDAEIERCYGRERQTILCGPAGFGFAEDIFGFHKGASPEKGHRLLVQLRYGLRDYGTGRKD